MMHLNEQGVIVIEDDDGEDAAMANAHICLPSVHPEETDLSKHSRHLSMKEPRLRSFGTALCLASSIGQPNITVPSKATHSFSVDGTSIQINSTFRNPSWGFRSFGSPSMREMNNNVASRQPRSFRLSPSPSSRTGTALEPIELDEYEDSIRLDGLDTCPVPNKNQFSRESSSGYRFSRIQSPCGSLIMLDDDDDKAERSEIHGMASIVTHDKKKARSRNGEVTRSIGDLIMGKEVIELEDMEDIVYNGVNIMPVEDVYLRDEEPRIARRSSQSIKPVPRNPSLDGIWEELGRHTHNKLDIAPNKTLELDDGTFVRVQSIFQNIINKEVQVRGIPLLRTRDLNGFLEKKMNEVVLFFEIDLDDYRDPPKQAAVPISLKQILRIRNTRFTNQKFPLCRNVDPLMYNKPETMAIEGGLTARWKYTCIYATAGDRHLNKFKERTLERLQEEDCGKLFTASNKNRRFQWRGETIRGGAYRPANRDDDLVLISDGDPSPTITIESTLDSEEMNVEILEAPKAIETGNNNINGNASNDPRTPKRKRSEVEGLNLAQLIESEQKQKKVRSDQETAVEKTRQGISNLELDTEKSRNYRSTSTIIDLTLNSINPPSIPQIISLLKSDLSTPPSTGSVISDKRAKLPSITRSAGQQLTYGDAFCGAGGATRGAKMAGFRVKWGFDKWDNACESWKANFPDAKCYQMESHQFVKTAMLSKDLDLMKVDILHLSPPCQFFSPAHTINGMNDEMNTASLFAVSPVIDVSKPRIATLEQTFGIDTPRFRFYFRSLIQMFTALDFSVRWAIIPLAQWGLPQRRNRLIVIASCPGEILPQMPAPTHSDSGSDGLRPFVSANHTLSQIPPNAPDHNPESVTFTPQRRMPPWDGDKILPRAMTTSGGQNYHPSGKRDLTLREYAAMQGFPMVHVFRGSYVKKQIGNAVPPVCAKVMFESVKKDLDRTDGVIEEAVLID